MFRRLYFFFEDFFGISPKESRGALVLLCLSLLLLCLPSLFRNYLSRLFEEKGNYEARVSLDSLVAVLDAADTFEGSAISSEFSRALPGEDRPLSRFRFDPNSATVTQLQELGIPIAIARRIDNYRNKGGKFYKKEDLLRIYGFPQKLYGDLESYIELKATGKPFTNVLPRYPEKRDAPSASYSFKRSPEIVPFDLNTADTTQLIRLRGIGSKLALRIVRFREGLGGFHTEEQLGEVFGLDSIALSELRRYGRIVAPVRKIAINTATYAELFGHTYLRRDAQMIRNIINYRTQHGPYRSLDDLRKLKTADVELLRKVAPYLDFN